jgi:hypothetical protein
MVAERETVPRRPHNIGEPLSNDSNPVCVVASIGVLIVRRQDAPIYTQAPFGFCGWLSNAECRRCPVFSRTIRPRSYATVPPQRGMVTMRWGMSASTGWWFSPKTLGTRPRRIGGVGSSRRAGARRPPTALRNMRPTQTPRPKRTWSDSRSARTGRCLRSLASGPNSKATRRTRSKPIPGPHQVYNFLMTAPKAIVEPIHPKPMPPGHRGRMQMRTGWPRLTKLATMLRIVPAVQFVFAKFATLLRSKSGTARQRVSRRSVRRHQMHG